MTLRTRLNASTDIELLGLVGNITTLTQLAATDTNSSVRQSAAEALGNLGETELAITTLTQLATTDTDSSVRRAAAAALGNLGGELAITTLTQLATTDTNSFVRQSAAETYERLVLRQLGEDWGRGVSAAAALNP